MKTEFRDAVSTRTVAMVLGVLVLQLAFIASYVGAFHQPAPHEIEVGVVAPTPALAEQLVQQLDAIDDDPLDPEVVASRAAAVEAVTAGDLRAALVLDPTGTTDELLVASGGGSTVATAVESVLTQVEQAQGRTLTTTDVVPLQEGDARGLTGFYLTIGWLVGGYLVAAMLGVARGARPATPRRAAVRLGAMVPYALASGIGGALVVGPWLDALTGHFWALAGLGTLLVLSAAAVTMAFQVLFGTIGVGLTVLLFVVLGNPSAGGAYQAELLPTFWRTIGELLPNGAGTEAVREIVYFGGEGVGSRVLLILGYIVVGVLVTLLASARRADEPEASKVATDPVGTGCC